MLSRSFLPAAFLPVGSPSEGDTKSAAGFTLIEIVIVLAIAGLLVAGATVGARALAKSELRGRASRVAGTMRFLFDRAVTTGRAYRLTFDFEGRTVTPEASEDRVAIEPDERERRPGEEQVEEQVEERAQEGAPGAPQARSAFGDVLPRPQPPRFEQFADEGFHALALGGIEIKSVWTPRRAEPVTEGRAHAYYFPQGFGERVILQLADGDDVYSLVQHPLTGRVRVLPYAYEAERGWDRDDLGDAVK